MGAGINASTTDRGGWGGTFLRAPLAICLANVLFFLAVSLRNLAVEDGVAIFGATLVCLAGLVLLWVAIIRFVWSHSERLVTRLLAVIFGLNLVAQLCVVWGLQVVSMLDLSWVIRQCESLADTQGVVFDLSEYWGLYPNNITLCVLVYWLMRAAGLVGVTNISLVGGVANVVSLQVAYLAFYKTLRRYADVRVSVCATLLLLANPLYLVHASYFYTDTMSLGPLMLGVYCAACCLRDEPGRKTMLFAAAAGAMFLVAFCIRSTSIFLPAALLAVTLVRRQWQVLRYVVVPFLVAGALVYVGNRALVRLHVPYDTRDSQAPVTHWLMLGANGETGGQYSRDDVLYTLGLGDYDAKVRGTLAEFEARWEGRSLWENIVFVVRKEAHTWARWDKEYHKTTAEVRHQGIVWELVHGSLSGPLHIYMRAYNLLLFVALALGLLWSLRGVRGVPPGVDVLCVYWCIALAFYVVWESHCRHSLSFYVPLTLLATPVFARAALLPVVRRGSARDDDSPVTG